MSVTETLKKFMLIKSESIRREEKKRGKTMRSVKTRTNDKEFSKWCGLDIVPKCSIDSVKVQTDSLDTSPTNT